MNELRALILTPLGRDAALMAECLERVGIESRICENVDELAVEAAAGAGFCVVAEELLAAADFSRLREVLQRQPPWSDLPLLVVIRPESSLEEVLRAVGPLGNLTPMVRPFRIQTAVSAARTLLRARERQYQARDMMQRLSDSDRRKTEFLALLGHELRNPLAAISVAAQLLEPAASGDDRCRRALSVIGRQTGNLARMVDDLLDISRITSGKIVLRREPVDLVEICDHVRHIVEAAARAAHVALSVDLSQGPIVVEGDPVRLEQIVSNVVGNALKYTPEGGSVSVSLRDDGQTAILCVRDDGIGIAQEMLGTIFEPFVQAYGARGRSRGGLGLGLALVRDLVDIHGGRVTAQSDGPGLGSTFTVSLPLSDRKVAAVRDAALASGRNGIGNRPVLLVEDNADIRELMAAMIESWGYPVELAAEGVAGVDLARRVSPRVALVDIGLPGIDGYEVARRVRELLPRESTRLVAMTGFGQPEDRARALQAGFDDHLVKPVEPDELRKLLLEVA